MSRLVLSLLLCCCWATLSHAATYWVSQSGTGGGCVNSGSRPANSQIRNTMNGGIACLSSGDTLMIDAGTYNEVIGNDGAPAAIPNGLSPSQPTTLRGTGVLLRPTFRQESGSAITLTNARDIVFDGISVDGSQASPYTTNCALLSGTRLTFQNAEFQQCQQGVATNADNATFFQFLNMFVHGIAMTDGGTPTPCFGSELGEADGFCHGYYLNGQDHLIQGGHIRNCNGWGVQSYRSADRNTFRGVTFGRDGSLFVVQGFGFVENNVFQENAWLWIGSSMSVVQHNTMYSSGIGNGLIFLRDGGGDDTVQNNILFNTSGGALIADEGGGTPIATFGGNICHASSTGCASVVPSADTLFVAANAGNLALRPGSPAIDAAASLATPPSHDVLGVSRPQGQASDIGAYEFTGGTGNTPPSVEITSPTSQPTWTQATSPLTTFGGTATDALGQVSSVTWACPTCTPTSGTASCAGCGTDTATWTVGSIGLAAGQNVITVTATDNQGAQTTDQLTVLPAAPSPQRPSAF